MFTHMYQPADVQNYMNHTNELRNVLLTILLRSHVRDVL